MRGTKIYVYSFYVCKHFILVTGLLYYSDLFSRKKKQYYFSQEAQQQTSGSATELVPYNPGLLRRR